MARFSIDGRIYNTASVDEISLKDLVLFKTQAADIGLNVSWPDIEQAVDQISAMKTDEAGNHPEFLTVIAVTIWVSRRLAGEDLAFGDAIDVPMGKLKFLPEPEDRKPNPTKGAAKKSSRKVSAPVESPEPANMQTTPQT